MVGVRLANREQGSGSRQLLDARLQAAGIAARRVRGYHDAPAAGHLAATPKTAKSRQVSSLRSRVAGSSVSAIDCSPDFIRHRPGIRSPFVTSAECRYKPTVALNSWAGSCATSRIGPSSAATQAAIPRFSVSDVDLPCTVVAPSVHNRICGP